MLIIYLGIDPGLSGGFGVLDSEGRSFTWSMPKTEELVYVTLKDISQQGKVICCLEKVHSMPGQGVASSFTFGKGYGYLRACLVSLDIEIIDVTPQKWMKHLEMKKSKEETKTEWKNRLKAKATTLYPNIKFTLKTCDAMLIAHYCKEVNQ